MTGNLLKWEFLLKVAEELYTLRAGVDLSRMKLDLQDNVFDIMLVI
jgi:hypothetical protein